MVSKRTIDIPSQSGRTALVTGTRGLGFHVARRMAGAGAHVILAGRDPANAADAVAAITRHHPGARVEFEEVDLASLASVGSLVARLARLERLDVLVANAGIMSPPNRRTTAEGFELQFGVNYLAHFALAARLLPLLRRTGARMVSVTSLAHHYGKLDFGDLQRERMYRPGEAYCQSKLAQALFTRELQRRSDAAGWEITSVAAHPGFASTNLFENEQGAKSFSNFVNTKLVGPLIGQSADDGAQAILYATCRPEVEPGALYGPRGFMSMKGPPGPAAYGKSALDEAAAARLWEVSEKLVDVSFA